MTAFFAGFVLSLSFIIAIGAQNAFVLRQGLRGEYVLLVVVTCTLSEVVLVFAGVAGFGAVVSFAPWLPDVMRYGGAAFLCVYGFNAFRSAWQAGEGLSTQGKGVTRWQTVFATVMAVTWLNPHTILDTTLLIGSISLQYGAQAYVFGAGAVSASALFFVALGYGARLLAPVFARPRAWQVLDICVGATMWVIAFGLIFAG